MTTRISQTFEALHARNQAGFVTFSMAGDPDYATSLALMHGLAGAGADVIELGMCFTDPMADGPTIQAAGLRALAGGQTLAKTLEMAREFRNQNKTVPVILMGYYNPISSYGVERFIGDAMGAGVDGVIVVDLPPEEDAELCLPARVSGLDFVRLATPTTDAARLPEVVKNASGFVYYVSVAGITGAGRGAQHDIAAAVARIKTASGLPVAVGFGISTPQSAAQIAQSADAVVVGSALISALEGALAAGEKGDAALLPVISLATRLAKAVHSAR